MADSQIIYLVLLLVLVLSLGGWRFLVGSPVSQTLRNISLWLGVAVVLAMAYPMLYPDDDFGGMSASEVPRAGGGDPGTLPTGPAEIRIIADRDGHYRVVARVNGTPVDFMVDTGATAVVLGPGDARRAGFDPKRLRYTGRTMTANGEIRTAVVRLDSVVIGGLALTNVDAIVTPVDMGMSLLGLTFLNRLRSFSFADGTLVLKN